MRRQGGDPRGHLPRPSAAGTVPCGHGPIKVRKRDRSPRPLTVARCLSALRCVALLPRVWCCCGCIEGRRGRVMPRRPDPRRFAMSDPREVVVLSGARTAIGGFGGSLKDVPPSELAAVCVREAVGRAGVAPEEVGHVV